ncbi:hypothetical protein V2A60_006759 [Cordyceps javanica]
MSSSSERSEDAAEFARHMQLLRSNTDGGAPELESTPIFSASVRKHANELLGSHGGTVFTQYGLLGGVSQSNIGAGSMHGSQKSSDPRLFYNVASPSSVFICGSQGSGKSHSLSCLLENCLLPSDANQLPRPLTGVVFHYDTFNSDTCGAPSEAAYLSSNPNVKVRVLCAPTNRVNIEKIYSTLPNVVVTDFKIHESQLNTKRMLDLMAMGSVAGDGWPLYMHTVTRILREMRLEQQTSGKRGFSYEDFKRRLTDERLDGPQLGPLQQRLDALESFMVAGHATKTRLRSGVGKQAKVGIFTTGNSSVDETWTPEAGLLTIVDLSCPCITDVTACSLFTICLSLFLEQKSDVGRVVALDEAHKYMTGSAECETLTERLLSAIRLQRHLAARVFISTQEPTISPRLLDLCSATIVHRFTSPEWLDTLRSHLAGASPLAAVAVAVAAMDPDRDDNDAAVLPASRIGGCSEHVLAGLFRQIVSLRTGEALLFAPNAAIGVRSRARVVSEDDTDSQSCSTDGSASIANSLSTDQERVLSNEPKSNDELSTANDGRAVAANHQGRREAMRLGSGVLKVFIRQRVTQDGGKSVMAG